MFFFFIILKNKFKSEKNLPFHEHLSLLNFGGAVQSHIGVTMETQKTFQNVQHFCHLRKNKHPMATSFQIMQKPGLKYKRKNKNKNHVGARHCRKPLGPS